MNAEGYEAVANLNSQIFENSDDTFCIHFWFYSSAPNIGTLNVLKTKANDDSNTHRLWSFLTSESTTVSDSWQEGQVQYLVLIYFTEPKFSIIFSGKC